MEKPAAIRRWKPGFACKYILCCKNFSHSFPDFVRPHNTAWDWNVLKRGKHLAKVKFLTKARFLTVRKVNTDKVGGIQFRCVFLNDSRSKIFDMENARFRGKFWEFRTLGFPSSTQGYSYFEAYFTLASRCTTAWYAVCFLLKKKTIWTKRALIGSKDT